MKGLELSRAYWEQVGLPAFSAAFPQLLPRMAVGLAGDGSECFGFDDPISRDHDWGPSFCVWMEEEDYIRFGAEVQASYLALPKAFREFPARQVMEQGEGRVGCLSIQRWFARYTGCPNGPESLEEWLAVPESLLAAAANGEVFHDPLGSFTAIRTRLQRGYPEDVRRKKLSARLAAMAQAGQYNYPRCMARREYVAAELAASEFMSAALSAIYLLNRRYAPFYKWSHRGLSGLARLSETTPLFTRLAQQRDSGGRQVLIETICEAVADELRRQGLSDREEDFLIPHAQAVLAGIGDDRLRHSQLMELRG